MFNPMFQFFFKYFIASWKSWQKNLPYLTQFLTYGQWNFHMNCAQRSIVELLVFLMYINDIVKSSDSNSLLFYMPQVSIFIFLERPQKFSKNTYHELKKIDHCVHANKLCINYSKNNFMLMNSHNNINCSASINHHLIKTKCWLLLST